MKIDSDKCKCCGICKEVCPLDVIIIEEKKIQIGAGCVECKTCSKVCPEGALSPEMVDNRPTCTACPIMCRIPEGAYGACMRYYSKNGAIVRKERVHTYEEVETLVRSGNEALIGTPLITGIGAGTTYPDFIPSPFIVSGVRDSIDIVTVVTEAPLSYSGMKLKIDTDRFLGEETKRVFVKRKAWW